MLGDMTGLILPLGISVVVTYIETESGEPHARKLDEVRFPLNAELFFFPIIVIVVFL